MSTLTLTPQVTRLPHRAAVGVSPVAAQLRPTLRLTRRGRVVVVLAALAVAFVVGAFVAAAGVATEHPGTPAPTRIVQVHDGDTLWDIASGLSHGGDVRMTMTTIEHLNALSSSDVHVGQRLVVPAG